jgi:CubicO group peptidase (beta-lactamase class C family)
MVDAAALETIIETERERSNVPGLAVAVVKDGAVVLARGFGLRDRDAGLPVTDQTLFPIGSSTKSFTASLVATLVDDGLIDWDTPLREYLPGFRLYDPVATELLTARDMLSHRSGLPRHDLMWIDNVTLTRADVVARLRHLPPNKAFREKWQYNNLMYITAGHLAEHFLGDTWEQAVRDRFFTKLGMTNTNFSVVESQQSPDHATPYEDRADGLRSTPWRGLDLAGPAGSINSCVADMAKWAILNANGGEIDGRRVLSEAAVRELHTATMVLSATELSSIADQYPEAHLYAYGMGWFLENYRGHTLVHHGGNIDGFSSMVSVLPAEHLGVVVLTNLGGTHARDVIPYVMHDALLGLDPVPWGTRLREAEVAMRAGMREAQAEQAARSHDVPPTHTLREYTGEYAHPGYGTFRVTLEGDALIPHYNAFEGFTLAHRHYDIWDLRLDAFEFVTPVSFAIDVDGDIASLAVQFESSLEPIVFARQPDPALAKPELLARYQGRYALGPHVLDVELDPSGRLTAAAIGEHLELVPHRDRRFKVAGHPALQLEFTLAGDRVASVLVHPVGVFVPSEEGSS